MQGTMVGTSKRRQSQTKGGGKGKSKKHRRGEHLPEAQGGGNGTPPMAAETERQGRPSPPLATPPGGSTVFSLRTGGVLPAQIVPKESVNVTPGEANGLGAQNTAETHECKEIFEDCQRNGRMDTEEMLVKDITTYVRYELFPKLKFIMTDRLLQYSSDPDSMCSIICGGVGVKEAHMKVAYWGRFSKMIGSILNMKRNDVIGAVKKGFMRKSVWQRVCGCG